MSLKDVKIGNKSSSSKVIGQFICPVILVTTEFQGKSNVMTASWATPISYNPLLIVISISSSGYTYELLRKSGKFGINIASTAQVTEVNLCGSRSGRECNKLIESGFSTFNGKESGVPLIKGCVVNIECKLVTSQQVGGSIIIGQAVSQQVDETKNPLVFFRGSYWDVGELLGKYEGSCYWLD